MDILEIETVGDLEYVYENPKHLKTVENHVSPSEFQEFLAARSETKIISIEHQVFCKKLRDYAVFNQVKEVEHMLNEDPTVVMDTFHGVWECGNPEIIRMYQHSPHRPKKVRFSSYSHRLYTIMLFIMKGWSELT